jgi:hypothetical protein
MIKTFGDWSQLNENSSQKLITIEQAMKDHLDVAADSDAEDNEIDSIKTGYDAIIKELGGNKDTIVCLTIFDDVKGGYILGGDFFPQINIDHKVDDFTNYYELPRTGAKNIWDDKVWEYTPGSNYIESFMIDGVKLCEWNGSGFDEPWIFANLADLDYDKKI